MGTKDNMEDAVKGTGKDVSDAKYEHSKKAKALKEFNERMAAPAKHEAKAREDVKLAEAAQGGLGALAAKHRKEAGEAAGASAAAAAAHALKKVKEDVVKAHQDQRNATAKKIESMQMQ